MLPRVELITPLTSSFYVHGTTNKRRHRKLKQTGSKEQSNTPRKNIQGSWTDNYPWHHPWGIIPPSVPPCSPPRALHPSRMMDYLPGIYSGPQGALEGALDMYF